MPSDDISTIPLSEPSVRASASTRNATGIVEALKSAALSAGWGTAPIYAQGSFLYPYGGWTVEAPTQPVEKVIVNCPAADSAWRNYASISGPTVSSRFYLYDPYRQIPVFDPPGCVFVPMGTTSEQTLHNLAGKITEYTDYDAFVILGIHGGMNRVFIQAKPLNPGNTTAWNNVALGESPAAGQTSGRTTGGGYTLSSPTGITLAVFEGILVRPDGEAREEHSVIIKVRFGDSGFITAISCSTRFASYRILASPSSLAIFPAGNVGGSAAGELLYICTPELTPEAAVVKSSYVFALGYTDGHGNEEGEVGEPFGGIRINPWVSWPAGAVRDRLSWGAGNAYTWDDGTGARRGPVAVSLALHGERPLIATGDAPLVHTAFILDTAAGLTNAKVVARLRNACLMTDVKDLGAEMVHRGRQYTLFARQTGNYGTSRASLWLG